MACLNAESESLESFFFFTDELIHGWKVTRCACDRSMRAKLQIDIDKNYHDTWETGPQDGCYTSFHSTLPYMGYGQWFPSTTEK